jgi:hypothetical protein
VIRPRPSSTFKDDDITPIAPTEAHPHPPLHTAAAMRLSTTTALSWSAGLATAATSHVYILDAAYVTDPTAQHQAPSLSPKAARLALAQRAGVEGFHTADLKDDGVIDAINTFGVRTSIFGNARDEREGALVLVEGGEEVDGMMPLYQHTGSWP